MARIKVKIGTRSGGRRGWVKHVQGLDLTRDNGYAFQGPFLRGGSREVPTGDLVLDCWPTGSARRGGQAAALYVADPLAEDGLREIARTDDWLAHALTLRDAAQAHLAAQQALQATERGALLAERERLAARLAEIDTELHTG